MDLLPAVRHMAALADTYVYPPEVCKRFRN